MKTTYAGRIAVAASAAMLLLAAAAPAAEAPLPTPKVAFSGTITPDHITKPTRHGVGTPGKLSIRSRFWTEPASDGFVIEKAIVNLPGPPYAVTNSKLFPSCSADKINRARGSTRVCPKGSQIGSGRATGTAIDLDITSFGLIKMFNGPRGRSIVFHLDINRPAKVVTAFDAPLVRTKKGYRITMVVPPELRRILDSRIVVKTFDVHTNLLTTTQRVKGRKVKRGYVEGLSCPKKAGGATVTTQIFYEEGVSTRAQGFVPCRQPPKKFR